MGYDIERTRKIQNVLLEMMKELHKVLNENGYWYCLSAGSVLGAIRHDGFIPWDDDLDIAMPREDYNRFLEEAGKILPDNMYLQYPGNQKKTHVLFAKVRLKNTLFEEVQNKDTDYPRGIYIDIFPLDYINGTGKKEKNRLKYARIYKSIYFLKKRKDTISIGKKICKIFAFLIPSKLCIKQYDYLICNKKNGEYLIDSYSSYAFERIVYPKSIFDNRVLHKFEDAFFYIPVGWDSYLKIIYGDYMVLPPEEKRGIQHTINRIEFKYDDSRYFKD